MITWWQVGFQDAGSPVMEEFIYFHDYAMVGLIFILTGVPLIIVRLGWRKLARPRIIEIGNLAAIWVVTLGGGLIPWAIVFLSLLCTGRGDNSYALTLGPAGPQWDWPLEIGEFDSPLIFDSSQTREMNDFRLLDVDNYLVAPLSPLLRALVSSLDFFNAQARLASQEGFIYPLQNFMAFDPVDFRLGNGRGHDFPGDFKVVWDRNNGHRVEYDLYTKRGERMQPRDPPADIPEGKVWVDKGTVLLIPLSALDPDHPIADIIHFRKLNKHILTHLAWANLGVIHAAQNPEWDLDVMDTNLIYTYDPKVMLLPMRIRPDASRVRILPAVFVGIRAPQLVDKDLVTYTQQLCDLQNNRGRRTPDSDEWEDAT